MNLQDAIQKARLVLDEERMTPTVGYEAVVTPAVPAFAASLAPIALQNERGKHPRLVREQPEKFQFKTNFDLLCAILDQLPKVDRSALFASLSSRIANPGSFRHRFDQLWDQDPGRLPRRSYLWL